MKKTLNHDGEVKLDPQATAIPCGWRAYTYFNGKKLKKIK